MLETNRNLAGQTKPNPLSIATRFAILCDVAGEALKNLAMMSPFVRKLRLRHPRTAKHFQDITAADLSEFGMATFEMLMSRIPVSAIQGATAIEIGPGDNLVTGMPLLALGASSYHAIDRFLGEVDSENAHRLYARVAEELPNQFNIPRQAIPDPRSYPKAQIGKRIVLHREGIEGFASLGLSDIADLVFSHDVGQHVASVEALARASYCLLKPGGIAIHHVNFGPTGCWCDYQNPLTFLTVSPLLWRLTGSHRGASNRVRLEEFRSLFVKSGLHVTIHILDEFTKAEMDEIRPFLAPPFKFVTDENLAAWVAELVCVKPKEREI